MINTSLKTCRVNPDDWYSKSCEMVGNFFSETGSSSACKPGFAEAAAGNDWGSAHCGVGEEQAESTEEGNWLCTGVMNMRQQEVIK